jgi:hypothetical protein
LLFAPDVARGIITAVLGLFLGLGAALFFSGGVIGFLVMGRGPFLRFKGRGVDFLFFRKPFCEV